MIDGGPFQLAPIGLVAVSADCHYYAADNRSMGASHTLPDTSVLCSEESFTQVRMGWSEQGLSINVQVLKPYEEGFFPEVHRGDSVELFIDTRDLKTAGFNTRFCHHFYFLGRPVDGKLGGEITRFRTEDVHEWCDSAELSVKPHLGRKEYTLEIFIPAHCLHGYAPDQFDRLGFTYRINRVLGHPQHFSVNSDDYSIDQQPALWGSLKLIR